MTTSSSIRQNSSGGQSRLTNVFMTNQYRRARSVSRGPPSPSRRRITSAVGTTVANGSARANAWRAFVSHWCSPKSHTPDGAYPLRIML
jgi:hypothetical protein